MSAAIQGRQNASLLLQTALDKADEAQKEMQSIPEAPSLQDERISTGAHTSATDRDTFFSHLVAKLCPGSSGCEHQCRCLLFLCIDSKLYDIMSYPEFTAFYGDPLQRKGCFTSLSEH